MALQGDAPAHGATFEHFGQLPGDIRQDIWRAASALPTSTPGIAYFEDSYSKPRREPSLIVHEPHNRNVLGTNTEAHDIALMTDAPTRPYNPEIDILCITNIDAFENFTSNECSKSKTYKWVTKIRHLAISLSLVDRAHHRLTQGALVRLVSLQTLSIVYPAPSGKFDFLTVAEPPEDRSTRLRRLTEDELGSLTIEANYMYNTWAGDTPVQWSWSGTRHLKVLEDVLDKDCAPRNAEFWGLSPLWDHENNRIALRYTAMCFQPLPARAKFNQQN